MASLSNRKRFPELYNQAHIDRRTCTRVVPMRVLVLGMMRTGTTSMLTALEQLGLGPVYHMTSIIRNPPDSLLWSEALDAKFFAKGRPFTRTDWDQLLGHCASVTDLPCTCFSEELIAAYLDAKVILTNRDVDAWYKSVTTTIVPALRNPFMRALAYLDNDFLSIW